jgi:CRISPR-associated protein Csx17
MSIARNTIPLPGCTPEPLMRYLKALGVLRLVAEQADPAARGFWQGDIFFLETRFCQKELCEFLLESYEPTPIVGPWGARSGFFEAASEKSGREALQAIEASSLTRLHHFSATIRAVRGVLASLGMTDKADSPEAKRRLMMQCRAMLPDQALDWLDATYMLLADDTKYPPLLGTGGNEGSGSYMSGFTQQVVAVLLKRQWDHALHPALFGTAGDRLATNQTPGHFSPSAAGGPNASSVSDGGLITNPWDYLLMLEGALMFAAACAKRLESHHTGALSYPFCVRSAGVGYGSAAADDEGLSRAEMWLPRWPRPAAVPELRSLFSEGRANLGARRARNGVDFARAICTLGVDRGISEFERYGFQQRNGLSYFAIPLGRFRVHSQTQIELLSDVDEWLDRFRREAQVDTAPATAGRALRGVEGAILDLSRQRSPAGLQTLLIALGECERVLATSSKWREEKFLKPLPLLSPAWLFQAGEGSGNTLEFRLAACLAGLSGSKGLGTLRQSIEPVAFGKDREADRRLAYFVDESAALASMVWTAAELERNLAAVVMRRVIEAGRLSQRPSDDIVVFPDRGIITAQLGDVAAFLDRSTDDRRIGQLVRGLMLLDWQDSAIPAAARQLQTASAEAIPAATFGLLKLCHTHQLVSLGGFESPVRLDSRIARNLAAGRLATAVSLAAERLRGSGLRPAFCQSSGGRTSSQRLLAALLFPVSKAGIGALASLALDRSKQSLSVEGDPASALSAIKR